MKKAGWNAAAGAVTLVLGLCVLANHLYVIPSVDKPTSSDVLFVLAPSYDRISLAENMMETGFAETLVVSSPTSSESGRPAICDEKLKYKVICFSPEPITTRGEARALRTLSQEYGWDTASVITARFHVSRARLIFQRCFAGDLNIIAIDTTMPVLSLQDPKRTWLYHFAYETGAFAKAAIDPTC
ncbi:YdcF family protein [Pseudarthrobacter sp. LMD1-1-1.1]